MRDTPAKPDRDAAPRGLGLAVFLLAGVALGMNFDTVIWLGGFRATDQGADHRAIPPVNLVEQGQGTSIGPVPGYQSAAIWFAMAVLDQADDVPGARDQLMAAIDKDMRWAEGLAPDATAAQWPLIDVYRVTLDSLREAALTAQDEAGMRAMWDTLYRALDLRRHLQRVLSSSAPAPV